MSIVDRTITYTPLIREVSGDEIGHYRRTTTGQRWQPGVLALLVVLGVVAVVIVGGDLLPTLVIVSVTAILIVTVLRRRQSQWRERLKMHLFAEANGFDYHVNSPVPEYPGLIFGLGHSQKVTDHFRTVDGRFLEFGNYEYRVDRGRDRSTQRWGFLALTLDRALPHMVLDSRANNGLFGSTNLPADLRRDQVLSLEGDFDRYFTLYCPKQYERDALYVFTPDLMALAIDEAAPFDMEIVDQWLFVYSARPFPLADPHTYQRLLRIVSTVGAKALSQTDRYRDERIGDPAVNLVAPQGQRLKKGVPWVGVAVIAGLAVLWLLTMLESF